MVVEPIRVLLVYSVPMLDVPNVSVGKAICSVGDGEKWTWQPVDFFPFEDPWPEVGRSLRHTAFRFALRQRAA